MLIESKTLAGEMMDKALKQAEQIKEAGLNAEIEIKTDVLDADGRYIASISITDKFVEFKPGFFEKGRLIPFIARLFEQGYGTNRTQLRPNENSFDIKFNKTFDLKYPIQTAKEVLDSYCLRKEDKVITSEDPEHKHLFANFRSGNIFAKEVLNSQGILMHVGDISNPAHHPQWFMTKEEWEKLKSSDK